MKTLILFLIFMPSITFAAPQIIEAGPGGFTHIDAIQGVAHINARSTLANDIPRVQVRCPRNEAGQPVQNYFVIKRPDARGILRNEKVLRTGVTCEQIIAEDAARQPNRVSTIKGCQGHSAIELVVVDPATNKCYRRVEGSTNYVEPKVEVACVHSATPNNHYIPLNLRGPAVAAEIAACGGNINMMMIRDTVSEHAIVNDTNSRTLCKIDRKRVIMNDSTWDDQFSAPEVQLFTSERPGFKIGAHGTNTPPDSVVGYHFDFKTNQWCQHILPETAGTAPTCDASYSNMSFPMSFATPNDNNRIYMKGVVQLSVKDGVPVAYIGTPKDSDPNTLRPEIDPTKPVMRVTLSQSDREGGTTKYESMATLNGPVRRSLTVRPTYSVGASMNMTLAAGSCPSAVCLRAPSTIAGSSAAPGSQCASNNNPIDLNSSQQNLCYSCNGITPGPCVNQQRATDPVDQPATSPLKTMITPANYQGMYDRINQCKAPATGQSPTGTVDTAQ